MLDLYDRNNTGAATEAVDEIFEIEWPDWQALVNDSFIPIIGKKQRIKILYGGRGSSKSNFAAKYLIYRMLSEPYFRFLMLRKEKASVRDSCYLTMEDIIDELGLRKYFIFRSQRMEIECRLNGNKLVAASMDEPKKVKSVKDPTGVWYEEDILEEDQWITIKTGLRTLKTDMVEELFTVNPEVEGEYEDHWFYNRFFASWYDPPRKVSYEDDKVLIHHSDHNDNKWLPVWYRDDLEEMEKTNPYYYLVYSRGYWGNRTIGGRFYKDFDVGEHSRDYLQYDPDQPLHISFDFNIVPYMICVIAQVRGDTRGPHGVKVNIIDELVAEEPINNTPGLCNIIMDKYGEHRSGVFVYGDPGGIRDDTRTFQRNNDYKVIAHYLRKLSPQIRVDTKAPPVAMRANWMNEIFRDNWGKMYVTVNKRECPKLIDDLMYLKEMSDGSKYKEAGMTKNKVKYQKRGHASDAMDYFMCRCFRREWNAYKSGRGVSGRLPWTFGIGRAITERKFERLI